MSAGYTDPTTGVWIYGEDDVSTRASDMLNLGQESVRAALTPLVRRVAAPTSLITAAAGWTINTLSIIRSGTTLQVYISVTRTGAAITAPADGNIANVRVADIDPSIRPGTTAALSAAGNGKLTAAIATSAGALDVVSFADALTLATGDQLSWGGTWITAGVA